MTVRVTPRSAREGLAAGTPDHLVARVRAAPVDGAANAAVIALVAQTFGVARRDVAIVAGDTARVKRLRIIGDTAALEKVAAAL